MSMETRPGVKSRYYYLARRVGGRVVKRYAGCGEMADLGAKLAEYERQVRELDELAARFDHETLVLQTQAYRAWTKAADGLVRAAMEAAGFRRIKRMWRRKRGTSMSALQSVEAVRSSWVPTELVAAAGGLLDADTLGRANAMDPAALRVVREYLDRPAAVALWGDASYAVMASWVGQIAGRDLMKFQAMAIFADGLRTRLAGPDPDPLVLLLAERVVLAWLFSSWADLEYAKVAGTADARATRLHLGRMECAQRQLLSAARCLAKAKRSKIADIMNVVNIHPPGTPAAPGPRVVDPAGAAGGATDAAD